MRTLSRDGKVGTRVRPRLDPKVTQTRWFVSGSDRKHPVWPRHDPPYDVAGRVANEEPLETSMSIPVFPLNFNFAQEPYNLSTVSWRRTSQSAHDSTHEDFLARRCSLLVEVPWRVPSDVLSAAATWVLPGSQTYDDPSSASKQSFELSSLRHRLELHQSPHVVESMRFARTSKSSRKGEARAKKDGVSRAQAGSGICATATKFSSCRFDLSSAVPSLSAWVRKVYALRFRRRTGSARGFTAALPCLACLLRAATPLSPSLDPGLSRLSCGAGRPCDGKTGNSSSEIDAAERERTRRGITLATWEGKAKRTSFTKAYNPLSLPPRF